jgi:hypothetical protein
MKNRRTKNTSAVLISILALFFVLSLSVHNHAFNFGTYSKKISQSKASYASHSNVFCSACRLNGNIKPHDFVNILDLDQSRILIGYLNFNVLIPSLSLESNKIPRSPPTI